MKSYRKELWFNVPGRRAFINITPQVEECLGESGVEEGLVLVNAMHITASVFINDDESGLHQDYETWLEQLAPHEPISRYHHNKTGEDNADAHIKRQVMGREVVVAITRGQLDFGPWEQIFYGEFDGGRRKRVLVKIIGECCLLKSWKSSIGSLMPLLVGVIFSRPLFASALMRAGKQRDGVRQSSRSSSARLVCCLRSFWCGWWLTCLEVNY